MEAGEVGEVEVHFDNSNRKRRSDGFTLASSEVRITMRIFLQGLMVYVGSISERDAKVSGFLVEVLNEA